MTLPSGSTAKINATGDITIDPTAANDVIISGSTLTVVGAFEPGKVKTTGNIIGADVKLVDFGTLVDDAGGTLIEKPAFGIIEAMEKLVVTEGTTTFLDFETITTENGDIIVQNETTATATSYDNL
ncbi:uncharacterized protein METZ01_LOCUS161131 [marine metagenome]|uniref:Uncharacterized protein n=1 Tax=marine metagenome TaxID=408172 RepID=A0A382B4X9_9ZZZZ